MIILPIGTQRSARAGLIESLLIDAPSYFITVLAVAIFHISNINGMRNFDIENALGQLLKKDFSLQRSPSLEEDENTGDFQKLVHNIVRSPPVQIELPNKDKELISNEKERSKKYGQSRYWPWKQIIKVKPPWLLSPPRKQNYPLNHKEQEDGDNDLGDYSKVYLVLDPDVDITESDVRDISNMVSSVLTKPSTPRNSSLKDRVRKKRYKGFVVKDNNIMNRRRMRDSKEMYAEKDSIERDYKPKRARADYRGGGGRTPIPYIRHRGDIYEKE